MSYDGGNGNGAGLRGVCATCPVPSDVWRLGTRMLVLERDITATIASMQAVEERLSTLTRLLGEEVGRLASCVQEIHAVVRPPQREVDA